MPADNPCLFVFMGLIASGKSTLARAFATSRGLQVYNSDVVRKALVGQQDSKQSGAAFASGIYTPEFSRRTYEELLRLAGEELCQGRSVVLDASYHKREERQHLITFCNLKKIPYRFILCQAQQAETKRRLDLRAQDPDAVSDGTWDIYLRQKEIFQYPAEVDPDHFIALDTNKPVNELLTLLVTSRIFPPFSS